MADVEHKVLKYKSYLETNQNGNKVLYIFTRLTEMVITIDILQRTGIGKVVNSFRKKEGEIGQLAKDIVARWRSMVAEEALRLEAEAEAKEAETPNEVDSECESESEQEVSADSDETDSKTENFREPETKLPGSESVRCRSDADKRQTSSKTVEKESKNHRHHKQVKTSEKNERNKPKSSHSKHSSAESKHKSSNSNHTDSDSKHRSSDSKQKNNDSKHKSSDIKHTHSDSNHKNSESKHTNSDNKHKHSESKHKSSDSKHSSSNSKHSSSEYKQKSSEKKPSSSEHKTKTDANTHKSVHSTEQNASSSGKYTEKSEKGSVSLKDPSKNDGHHVKRETTESVKESSTDNSVLPDHNETIETGAGSDDDPLHWEMLESFEEIKSHNSSKSGHDLSPQEQHNEKRNQSPGKMAFIEQNKEIEKKNYSICDSKQSTISEKVLKDDKIVTEKREHSKDRDHESKHKHREKTSKSHHSGKKEGTTEKDKHHRDESSHKSKHKHKHSDKDKEHKHSKQDKSDKREVIQDNKEPEKQSSESKEQGKEKERSSILESLSHEVEEGKFVSEDVPGLWFLNSNNNSFLADKDLKDSKLEVPCETESSKVKVDSHSSDKIQDNTKSSDKSLTSESDKKEKKRHKHSKERESSSSKHKPHKDSKSKHDSKHHRDKKRKHSGDTDESKPSKSRRKNSQDGMSFEDLLTAGASDTKPSKLSQNDYAKLKSKFKVKRKGDNSPSNVPAKKGDTEMKIQITEEDVLGALPQPNTHYRPWRLKEVQEKKKTEEELLDEFIAATKTTGRTQMYSGKKQNFVPEVYKLFDMCMTVLCNNIDSLEYVGGVPFAILKPVLEKCTAAQLYRLEDFNPHFLEESDTLWMNHCHKEFRLSKPEEMETWREHYLRKFDEREEKLKKISANINASMAKKVPERKTQLAYIDSAAKPPRNVRRQQAKYGTAGPSSGERSRARFLPSMDLVPVGRSTTKAVKPSAPMMAKTLTMMKKIRR